MRWLAANTVIQNWDAYGNITHNYYLYNKPETNQLNWIPWDNNEAFTNGKGNNKALSLDMTEVNEEWPIICYLMDSPDYKAVYDGYSFLKSDDDFDQAVKALKSHVVERNSTVEKYLIP